MDYNNKWAVSFYPSKSKCKGIDNLMAILKANFKDLFPTRRDEHSSVRIEHAFVI